MEFDRKGPGEGIEIFFTVDGRKAFLECKVHLRKGMAEELMEEAESALCSRTGAGYLEIRIWDREERLVLNCRHSLLQEEPARGLILHPHLWQGMEDPYRYRVRVYLMEKEDCISDMLETTLSLHTFRQIPGKGWFLNGQPLTIRPVAYEIPSQTVRGISRGRQIRRDLELLAGMGANAICPAGGRIDRELCQICEELGFILWWQDPAKKNDCREKMPAFHGMEDGLFTLQGHFPTERYYFYKACWSSEPFVYICMKSLHFQKNGNAEVTVYSNQKKVALYVEGVLFEFQSEGPEFVFQELPVKKLPMLLTAEAGECSMSVTACPFTKCSQSNHFSMTIRE